MQIQNHVQITCEDVRRYNIARFQINFMITVERMGLSISREITTYPFKTAWEKYADGAIRHRSLKLSGSNTPMLPSQKVA